jgi:predicted ATPase
MAPIFRLSTIAQTFDARETRDGAATRAFWLIPCMPHLRSLGWKSEGPRDNDEFPFAVPSIRTLPTLDVSGPVTLFVGENGSGKSTVMEGIALAARLPTVGAVESAADDTLAGPRRLAAALRLTWSKRVHRGFFLRAEDFFGFQKRVIQQQRDLQERIAEVESGYQGRSELARGLARGPAASELRDIERRYGSNPDARSHGEAFLDLFRSRFTPGGLYLLDEPEAALSPQSQLALLVMLFDMVEQDAQFIIATHSPILLACPDATIYSFDHQPVERIGFDDSEHVRLTRDFLGDPERYLRRLRGR